MRGIRASSAGLCPEVMSNVWHFTEYYTEHGKRSIKNMMDNSLLDLLSRFLGFVIFLTPAALIFLYLAKVAKYKNKWLPLMPLAAIVLIYVVGVIVI